MIIITGGAGFIGSNLVAGLEAAGAKDLVVCDWLGNEDKWLNISKRSLHGIIRPENLLTYLDAHKGRVEAIFHLGAISSTTERDVDLIVERNITLSQKLWTWCAEQGVRFIYASSAATYGDGTKGFKDDESAQALAQLSPLNPYGWSKHFCDRYFMDIVHKNNGGIPPQWAGLKFFNVYGPNEYHKEEQTSVVCKLYPQILNEGEAKLFKSDHKKYADGGQIRDFVHVNDCVSVMLWLYANANVSGLFNVGSGVGRSFNDLAHAVFKAIGKPAEISYIEMPDALKSKYQYYTQADMTKLQAAGYKTPMTSLEDGVKDYIQNFLCKEDMYR